jgi:hypothetical protein
MHRSLIAAGLFLQCAPAPAVARDADRDTDQSVALIEVAGPSLGKLQAPRRRFGFDDGDLAFSFSTRSLRVSGSGERLRPDCACRVHDRRAIAQLRYDLAPGLNVALSAEAGRRSSLDRGSAVLANKVHSNSFQLAAGLAQPGRWRLAAGWATRSGWGGHGIGTDTVALVNGGLPSGSESWIDLDFPLTWSASFAERRITFGIEARDVRDATFRPGARDVSLHLASRF